MLEEGAADVTALPEAALARGARPLWLGHLGVRDVKTTTAAFVARGAVELAGGKLMRDPSGALLALAAQTAPSRRDVAWAQLLTGDVERAKRDYADLFEATFGPRLEVDGHGTFERLAWSDGAFAGSIGDIRGKPHIHPQWTFYFRVPDLVRALADVVKRGGRAIGPTPLPDGRRVGVCDDPQGAAFGLIESPHL